jgi:hypothetical protein
MPRESAAFLRFYHIGWRPIRAHTCRAVLGRCALFPRKAVDVPQVIFYICDRLQSFRALRSVDFMEVVLNKVYREEKKFLINIEDFLKTSHYLDGLLMQDEHNGTFGYRIRSLYFDSACDQDYFEKLDGMELRRKIRLRVYDPASDFAMLEMKQKEGPYQLKRSLRIAREDAERMTRGDYSPLLHYEEDFAAECYALMQMKVYRPKTIVEYNRKAFIAKENKIRVTFDNNIVATETDFDLFSTKLNMDPVLDKFAVVLEVKYNGFLLDYIRNMLSSVDKSELSVSKYMLARQATYRYIV